MLSEDLEAADARQAPGGDGAFLRGLPDGEAARVMGSKARALEVMGGVPAAEVLNRGKNELYKLARLGDGGGHALVMAAPAHQAHEDAVQFIDRAISNRREKQPPLVLSAVSQEAIDQAKVLGIDLAGKSVALDHDGVLHILGRHGAASEKMRGQEPIEASDLAAFAALFNAAGLSAGDPPKAKDGALLLAGSVVQDGWSYTLVAKVRRRHVVPYTLFKRRHK